MKRIMVVDDVEFMRLSVKNILESNSFKVVGEAKDGVSAIKKYKECRPDIVVMDILMPKLNGIETLKAIKQIDKNCKVIIISAIAEESIVKEAVISGARNFIVKPFEQEVFIRAVKNL